MKESDKLFIESFKNKRIGYVETRVTSHFISKEKYIEFIHYYPNQDFCQESKYEWDVMKGMYKVPGYNCYKDPSCFRDPECAYTISYVKFNDDEEPDVQTVGSRTCHLNNDEWVCYKELLNYFYDSYNKYYDNL